MENNLNFPEKLFLRTQFGEKLRTLREIYDIPQRKIAELLGVDRSTYAYYELGKTEPSLSTLRKIACLFHVSADFLLDISEAADPELERRADHMLTTFLNGRPKL